MITRMNFLIFKNGIKFQLDHTQQSKKGNAKRDEIKKFSKKSQNRLAWNYSQGPWVSMLTLTYHLTFPDGVESKKHLNVFLNHLRIDGVKFLWVLEFQGRGFPHYHVWLSQRMEKKQWSHYMEKWLSITIEHNGSDKARRFHLHDNVYTDWDVRFDLNYAVKYANKQSQKWLPIGVDKYGRFWGVSRDVIFPERDLSIDFDMSNGDDICLAKHLTALRRNIKRCIFHWSYRKKPNKYDRKTNQGFTYILKDSRKQAIDRLYDYAIACYESQMNLQKL